MSIFAYTGLPGSGKSYDVVENQVLPALKAGRHVVTNVPLNLEALREVVPSGKVSEFPTQQVQASPELIDQWAVPGCVLILDEVWRLFPAGQKANHVPEPFRKLLAEHRHMVDESGNAMQIVLVTQDLKQIGAFARQLVETTFHHKKLSHVGAEGSFRVDVYEGPQEGPNPPVQQRLRQVYGRYDPAIFKLYKSHTMSRADGPGANEKALDRRANVWHRPMIYVGLVFVVVALVWGIPAAKRSMHAGSERLPGTAGGTAVVPAARVSGAVSAGGWRISGRMQVGARNVAFVTDGRVTVPLPYARYCERSLDGWDVCRWEGQEVTPFSATRYQEAVSGQQGATVSGPGGS